MRKEYPPGSPRTRNSARLSRLNLFDDTSSRRHLIPGRRHSSRARTCSPCRFGHAREIMRTVAPSRYRKYPSRRATQAVRRAVTVIAGPRSCSCACPYRIPDLGAAMIVAVAASISTSAVASRTARCTKGPSVAGGYPASLDRPGRVALASAVGLGHGSHRADVVLAELQDHEADRLRSDRIGERELERHLPPVVDGGRAPHLSVISLIVGP